MSESTNIGITIRFPPQLIEKVDQAAETNRRSRSGEVQVRLEKSFEDEEKGGAA